jgi:hypothetical protein
MIKTRGKIKKGKRKNGGARLIAPDGRNVGHVKISFTEEDAEVAQLVGTDGHGVLERSIHSDLDRHDVPHEGREVEVDLDNIAIGLPYGWSLQSGLTRRRREELINNDRVSYLATYER